MALPLVGLVGSIASGWAGRVLVGYFVVKILRFLSKLGFYVAGAYFVYNLVQGQFNSFKQNLLSADPSVLNLIALARIDEAISIVISSILSGVLLKLGLRFLGNKKA